MTLSAFPNLKNIKPTSANISDITIRDFSGGLKETDNQTSLKSKYATILVNMLSEPDNAQTIRFGTKEFATCSTKVLNMVYFKQHIVAILENGEIEKIANDGTVTTIWDSTIAAALPGAPSGWSSNLTVVDFTEFRNNLIVTNGEDKPLVIDKDLDVTYLQDIPTGSNVNTPIAKYVTTVSNYVVMAGIENEDDVIYISQTGASGTWTGDPDPNDATTFNLGAYTGEATSEIHGLGTFKNFLIIFFDNLSIVVQLGTFNESGVHTPEVIDTYIGLGTINNKTILTSSEDVIFTSNIGIFSGKRNIFGGSLSTKGISESLGDTYPAVLGLVDKNNQDSCIVNDTLSKTMFFIFHKEDSTIEIWAMKYTENLSKIAWSKVTGWSFSSACSTDKGRVFFSENEKVYQYGNSVFTDEDYTADYITDVSDGNDIEFDWEFPWLDAGNRIKIKQLKKISFDTTGSSEFSLQCFVNNFYKDINDDYLPALEMNFVGGNIGGYGNNPEGYGGGAFGGGRLANDERFYGFPLKFKILKMRIYGSTKAPLSISSISLIYSRGNYNNA